MIETTEGGSIVIDGPHIALAAHLANWYAGKIEIVTGLKSRPARWAWMAAQCESYKRTHAGIFVDYTVWLAGYGIEPMGTERAADHLNKTAQAALARGLKQARKLAAKRKAGQSII